jgi:hypothetical protein
MGADVQLREKLSSAIDEVMGGSTKIN